MDYRTLICCAAAVYLLTCCGACAALGPGISNATIEPGRARRYQRVEVTFNLARTYDNPFDPRQIDAAAEVTAPSGSRFEVPAFPYQQYRSVVEADRERLEPVGSLRWKVRIASIEVGRHRLRLRARDAKGESQSSEIMFEVTPSDDPGFIRRSAQRPRRFAFDSGRPYFAIGENVCWPRQETALHDYELWFDHLRDAGCNYARLWLAGPWIATAPIHCPDAPDEVGPGRYSQRSSWRLDQVVQMAEERGIRLMLCLDSFNSLRRTPPYAEFDRYPLNAKFGGPLAAPQEFFTSVEARREFRQRLRYYVARWGYSTHVFAWEFFNEVDIIEHYDSAQVAAWHREMARYLRQLDPWDHLITTSFARSGGDPAIDGLEEMDFVQTHCYGPRDMAEGLLAWSRDKAAKYDKPHLIGEFGTDAEARYTKGDEQGIHLHNGLWASALSGDAGTAMTWWWDSYIEPRNLYHHFAALARFLQGVDWLREAYEPVVLERVEFPAGTAPQLSDLVLRPPVASWQQHPANQPREYQVASDGTLSDASLLSQVLHGVVNHRDKHNPPTFIVEYPAPGAFEVIIEGVSGYGGANLRIHVNGETRLAAEFPDTAPDDNETMHQYDGVYRIEVAPGPHRITVENEGKDWAFVSYRFVGCVTAPNLRVVGLASRRSALLWIQNRGHTWWNALHGGDVKPVLPALVTCCGFDDGEYTVQWWDTWAGRPVAAARVQAREGRLTLTAPEIARDVACKIRRR